MKPSIDLAGRLLPALALVGCRSTRSPSATDILERAETAVRPVGVPAPRTIVIEGTYEYTGQGGQHGVAPLYQHWRAPGVLYQEVQAPFGQMRRWFGGERGWASRPEFPNRPLGNAELSETRRDAALYQPWAMPGEYQSFAYEGRRQRGGKEYDVVAAQSRLGKTERFWFDPSTGLVRILDVWEEGPEGLRSVGGGEFYESHYLVDDYRPVGKHTLPFRIRRVRPNSSVDMRFASVRVDAPVDTLREQAPPVRADTMSRRQ